MPTTIRYADRSIASPPRCSTSLYHPPTTLSTSPAPTPPSRAGGEGRDRADPHQLEDVRRGPPPALPGHRHRQRIPRDRHGRASRAFRLDRRRHQRRRAPRLPRPENKLRARCSPTRCSSARTLKGQHAGRHPHAPRAGQHADLTVAAKGGGSENKSKFIMMNPSDNPVDWVLKTVPTMGAGWCPPGMLGIGVGGIGREGHAAGQGSADGADRHVRPAQARPEQQAGRAAHRTLREGQRFGHRRAGPGRPDHRARREDRHLPDARGEQAGGDDPQLRGDAPRPRGARRLRPGLHGSAQPGPVARRALAARLQEVEEGQPRHAHARGSRQLEAGRHAAAVGKMLTGRDAAHKRIQDMLARARSCPSISPTASSTTSARSIRCATRSSARPARRPRRAWTSSPR